MKDSNNRRTEGRLSNVLALLGRPLRRRIAAEPTLSLTFIAVIIITAAAVAAVPMILNRVGESGLFESLDRALVIQRGINVDLESRLPVPENDPLGPVGERGEAYRESLPETISSIIEDTQWVTESARHNHLYEDLTVATGAVERYFQFRYQSSLDEHVELLAGREPEPTTPVDLIDVADIDPEQDARAPRFEVMIGTGTSETMGLDLGDTFVILAAQNDRLNRDAPREYYRQYIAVEVVGIFQELDADNDFWYRDRRTFETSVFSSPDQTIYYSMGVPAEAAFQDLLALNEPGFWRYTWRNFVDPAAVELSQVNRTAADLQTLAQNLGPYHELDNLGAAQATRQINIRTMLPSLLIGAERQFRLTSAVLSLVIAGILTIGVALSGLLGALIANRRTAEMALVRSRGGSPLQLNASQIGEGLLLAVPAAAIGLAIASLVNGRLPDASALLAALAVALAGVIAVWALTRNVWAEDLGKLLGRRSEVPGGTNPRRVVVELLIIALAVGGIVLLRQRGLTTGAAREGVDPYVAAVPVLAGIATGIIAIRIFPWLLRQAARFAGRRVDLVPFMGFRRIAEPSLGRHLPLVVMILALGMAIFAGSIWYSVETPETINIEELDIEEARALTAARAGVNDAFREGVSQGFWLTMFAAVAYAGLAIVCALALTSDERRRDSGYLRTLGASERQTIGLTMFEQVPSAIIAGLIGAVFGGLLTWLILPGLDIASLYPPEAPVSIGVNWLIAIAQVIVLLLVAVGSAALFALAVRRRDLNDVLRAGD